MVSRSNPWIQCTFAIVLLLFGSQAKAGQEILDGPPASIDAGPFQSVLTGMWRDSPIFRWQCIQLGAASRLKARIRAHLAGPSPQPRARTEISRIRGVVTFADVVLIAARDHIELIAHEFEHIIEQLEGHSKRKDVCPASGDAYGESEICRAIDVGRRVAEEVQTARSSTLQGSTRASGSLGLGQNAARQQDAPNCTNTTGKMDRQGSECAPSTQTLHEGHIVGFRSGQAEFWIRQAVRDAARRLRSPECRRVLSDFTDASGNQLQTTIAKLAVDPGDYILHFVSFADGGGHRKCGGNTAAFTQPGSRVIFVCGTYFDKIWRVGDAEIVIIHEILHSLGLGENPPSTEEITKQVATRCGGRRRHTDAQRQDIVRAPNPAAQSFPLSAPRSYRLRKW
jgi:hypothetical protein